MHRKFLYRALFILIINFLLAGSVWAGIRIDKPKIRISVEAGSYASGEIKVENNGSEEVPVKVYLEDWVYSQQDGSKEFMPKGTTPLSCSNWITFYPADFTIPANGTQIVRYTVNIPKDSLGGHYSVMFFESGGGEIEEAGEEGTSVMIKILHRLGALFYVEPEGTIRKSAQLEKLDISQKLNNLIVTADFMNTGNTDITAKGTFNVLDTQGFVYARGEFDEAYTLPKDKASLRAVSPSTNLKAGIYDILITLEFETGGSLVKEGSFTVTENGAISAINTKN